LLAIARGTKGIRTAVVRPAVARNLSKKSSPRRDPWAEKWRIWRVRWEECIAIDSAGREFRMGCEVAEGENLGLEES
jgi:hypothetical protein